MRPKKRVLLVDVDEQALAVRGFMMTTRGYAVTVARTVVEVIDVSVSRSFDAAVISLEMAQQDEMMIPDLKTINPYTSVMVISDTVCAGSIAHQADRFIGKGQYDPYVFLEAIKVMTARKRGPRKASVSVSQEMAS